MTISTGSYVEAYDHLNIKSYNNDTHVLPNGQKKIYVHINNANEPRNVFLYLYGLKANIPTAEHLHAATGLSNSSIGNCASPAGGNACGHGHTITGSTDNYTGLTNSTSVPQAVQIWIDGTEYTATIDDPNAKGATMYDSVNDDWGVDGTTEWNTGKLNLTSVISWTAGEHYIEFKETGGTGGRLLYNLYINNHS
jgi:hypothetical protein